MQKKGMGTPKLSSFSALILDPKGIIICNLSLSYCNNWIWHQPCGLRKIQRSRVKKRSWVVSKNGRNLTFWKKKEMVRAGNRETVCSWSKDSWQKHLTGVTLLRDTTRERDWSCGLFLYFSKCSFYQLHIVAIEIVSGFKVTVTA